MSDRNLKLLYFHSHCRPQYGGSQCSGSEFIAELCNVQPCSTSQAKFQEEQCAATDNEPIQNHKYHWIPNTGALGIALLANTVNSRYLDFGYLE